MRKLHFFSTLVALVFATTQLWAKPAAADANGKLPGAFKINNDCGMVYFSQGNLQYIGSAATPYWKFADEQYEYFGDNGQKSALENVDRDLLGWGTAGYYEGATGQYQPYSTSGPNYQYVNYLTTGSVWDASKSDWGVKNAISNGGNQAGLWRALTYDEFVYILNTRSTGITIGEDENARFTMATVNTDSSTCAKGVILFPDGYDGPTSNSSDITWGTINAKSKYTTQCTKAGWKLLETKGCVLLPATGYRQGTSYIYGITSGVGDGACYWTSTGSDSERAMALFLTNTPIFEFRDMYRYQGYSVRLVKDMTPKEKKEASFPAASVTTPPSAIGLVYNGGSQTLVNSASYPAIGGTVKYRLGTSGDFSTTRPSATDAGVYIVQWFVESTSGCYLNSDTLDIPVTIKRASTPAPSPRPTVQAVTPLIYNGDPQNLVSATGELQSGYELVYSTDGTNWSTTIPQGTDLGNYTVYYKFYRGDNYEYVPSPSTIVATISDYPYVADNEDPTSKLEDFSDDGSMNLRVKRTIWADDEYNTICLPFALDASALAASPLAGYNRLKAFRGAQVSGSGASTNIDIFVEDATAIEAGVPYLISYPSAHADIVNPVFSGITVTTTTPGSVSADGVTFQGMFAQVHIDQHSDGNTKDYLFLGENSQLYWPLTSEIGNESVKMRGFRAYFIIDRDAIPALVAPRGTHARFVNAPKQPTAIENTELNTQAQKLFENGQLIILKNGIKYNAQGQVLK